MTVVDKALEVVDEFHAMIRKFEREVLMKPSVRTIRNRKSLPHLPILCPSTNTSSAVHILGGDLTMHKRTLEPIKTVIYGLRRYDLDRCAAVLDLTKTPNAQIVGFMSHKSKIYLADVYDHMDYVLTSLEMFSGIGDNLVDYTFNVSVFLLRMLFSGC
jgi:Mg2+ and Co2+ transporter CorA